jgi:hypothetical protein
MSQHETTCEGTEVCKNSSMDKTLVVTDLLRKTVYRGDKDSYVISITPRKLVAASRKSSTSPSFWLIRKHSFEETS